MSEQQQALLAAILEEPSEDAPRLIYADWLDEHGDSERAEFIRVQCELAARFGVPPDGQPVATGNQDADREEKCLRMREQQLLGKDFCRWGVRLPGFTSTYSRGFVCSVTCTCSDWLQHGPAIVRQQPVQEVTLSDKEPFQMGQLGAAERHRLSGSQEPFTGPESNNPELDMYYWLFSARWGQQFFIPEPLQQYLIRLRKQLPREYHSRVAAIEIMSAACLQWAKDSAGQK